VPEVPNTEYLRVGENCSEVHSSVTLHEQAYHLHSKSLRSSSWNWKVLVLFVIIAVRLLLAACVWCIRVGSPITICEAEPCSLSIGVTACFGTTRLKYQSTNFECQMHLSGKPNHNLRGGALQFVNQGSCLLGHYTPQEAMYKSWVEHQISWAHFWPIESYIWW